MSTIRTITLTAAAFALPAFAQGAPAKAPAAPAPAAAPAKAPEAKPAAAAKPTLRERVKTEKKAIVMANLGLTEDEAKKFDPVYEAYQKDLTGLADRMLKVIDEFGKNFESMDDKTAKKLIEENVAIEEARAKLMKQYLPKFGKVMTQKKVARYYQIENKLRAVVMAEMADVIPLVE
jgi:3-oxoacyl-ACP reductase-like protein